MSIPELQSYECLQCLGLSDPIMKAIILLQRTQRLIYGMLFYVIIYTSDKLTEIIRFPGTLCTYSVCHTSMQEIFDKPSTTRYDARK